MSASTMREPSLVIWVTASSVEMRLAAWAGPPVGGAPATGAGDIPSSPSTVDRRLATAVERSASTAARRGPTDASGWGGTSRAPAWARANGVPVRPSTSSRRHTSVTSGSHGRRHWAAASRAAWSRACWRWARSTTGSTVLGTRVITWANRAPVASDSDTTPAARLANDRLVEVR